MKVSICKGEDMELFQNAAEQLEKDYNIFLEY